MRTRTLVVTGAVGLSLLTLVRCSSQEQRNAKALHMAPPVTVQRTALCMAGYEALLVGARGDTLRVAISADPTCAPSQLVWRAFVPSEQKFCVFSLDAKEQAAAVLFLEAYLARYQHSRTFSQLDSMLPEPQQHWYVHAEDSLTDDTLVGTRNVLGLLHCYRNRAALSACYVRTHATYEQLMAMRIDSVEYYAQTIRRLREGRHDVLWVRYVVSGVSFRQLLGRPVKVQPGQLYGCGGEDAMVVNGMTQFNVLCGGALPTRRARTFAFWEGCSGREVHIDAGDFALTVVRTDSLAPEQLSLPFGACGDLEPR